jgi:hypothetical protein
MATNIIWIPELPYVLTRDVFRRSNQNKDLTEPMSRLKSDLTQAKAKIDELTVDNTAEIRDPRASHWTSTDLDLTQVMKDLLQALKGKAEKLSNATADDDGDDDESQRRAMRISLAHGEHHQIQVGVNSNRGNMLVIGGSMHGCNFHEGNKKI